MSKLWYDEAASDYLQALPMGNGFMGAMAFGGSEGKFVLSDNTCWSGEEPNSELKPLAKENMEKARQLLSEGLIKEAQPYLRECCGQKGNYGTQLPVGEISVSMEEEFKEQTRELDLMTGICTDLLKHETGTGTIKRVCFTSNVSKILAIQLFHEDKKELPRIVVTGSTSQDKQAYKVKEDCLSIKTKAVETLHSDGKAGVDYGIYCNIKTDGTVTCLENGWEIEAATYCSCYVTVATSMFDADFEGMAQAIMSNVIEQSFDQLKEVHIAEHKKWSSACEFTLPDNGNSHLPTDKRLKAYQTDPTDYSLVALLFEYGRYLLFSSSRPDSLLPAALQGIWNDNRACKMGWTDDMHLDINTQMNYFPAETTGLSECTRSLFTWIKDILMVEGEKIAKELYGKEGWVAHTVSNAYGYAAPGWDLDWGFFLHGGTWVATHIWEHFLYTNDEAFLKEYFDVIYSCAVFALSVLEENKQGEFVTIPSYSPENTFIYENEDYNVAVGSTADTIMTRYILTAVIEASMILGCADNENYNKIARMQELLEKLPKLKEGKFKQLQEWYEDYEEKYQDHRHTSHLLSLYPLNLINPHRDVRERDMVIKSLERRLGDNPQDIVYANWAGALLVLYYARLLEGEQAYQYASRMVEKLCRSNLLITHIGNLGIDGIYELDGNTGFTAGIVEMLLQSYGGELHILPAIPEVWATGTVTGLVAYGGHKVSLAWNTESIVCNIVLKNDDMITVRYGNEIYSYVGKKDELINVVIPKTM